jgi:DNA-binding response OmpR family regulator
LNKRILILDDHPAILEVVTEALLYEQFEVLSISLGSQLMDAIREFGPELVLLDYKLADTNGGDLCKALKETPEYYHIPVIIFSAYFTPADKTNPGGCDGILYKPFDLETLLATVALHLERHDDNRLIAS